MYPDLSPLVHLAVVGLGAIAILIVLAIFGLAVLFGAPVSILTAALSALPVAMFAYFIGRPY